MPKRLRFLMYTVLLGLSLYMYYLSGQVPGSGQPSPTETTVANQPVANLSPVDPLTPASSVGVRRDVVTTVFERTPFNLRFDFVPLADGRSRMIGRSADGRTSLELIGPPEGITAVSLMAALPEDQPLVRLKNLNAISRVVETVLSDWSGAGDWVGQNIDRAFSGQGVRTQRDGRTVTLSRASQTDTLVVTIMGPAL